ncbi:MAG: baseplate J/gp47 family protein [Terriglobales bacterium]|jgi:phage-related baseplate assembly protein
MPTNPFANLPAVSFASSDVNSLINQIVTGWQTGWQNRTGETVVLSPADRRYNFLASCAAFFVSAYEQVDIGCKQNTMPFALGGFCDVIGSFFGENGDRIGGTGATTTLLFTLPTPLSQPVTIPAGTQVSNASGANGLIFATTAAVTIAAGQVSASVVAECTTESTLGNGIAVNMLTTLIDWTANFVVSVSNVSVTENGAAPETDQAYMQRLFGVTDSFSPAGPKGRYKFFAERADPTISQVTVMGPEDGLQPGNVLVTCISAEGSNPSSQALTNVSSALNILNIRDLCALVTVAPPSGVNFTVSVDYYIPTAQANNAAAIQSNVANAVTEFVENITWNLNTNIDPTDLITRMDEAGAVRITVVQPTFQEVGLNQIGRLTGTPAITYVSTT